MAQYISQPRIEGPIWLEPSDISFLRTLIAEMETQAESLENQIKEANKNHITELTHRRDAKMVKIASLRNILSPIRRIPLDVLSEILELSCLPVGSMFAGGYDITRYISRVSLVCAAWRKAALATPKLWSKICVNDHHYPDVKQIKEWLAWSRGLSLELYLAILYRPPSDFDSQMDCILESRGRITLIDLSGSSHSFLPLFRLPSASFPLLEKLTLDIAVHLIGEQPGLNFLPDNISAFFGAPRLQHFSITETPPVLMLARLMLPLEQLTSLEIQLQSRRALYQDPYRDLDTFRDTIHRCKDLVSLKVNSVSSHGLGFDTELSICLPSLKFLDIPCWDAAPHHFTLLHGLTTPVLESLVLRWADQPIHDLCRDVIEFQNRSATTLSAFTLRQSSGTYDVTDLISDDLLPILAAFPTVQSFRVGLMDRGDVDYLIQVLIYSESNSVLLPRLTSFDISSWSDSSVGYMISLIYSRWWPDSLDSEISDNSGVSRLQKVTLRGLPFRSIVTRDDFNFPGLVVNFEDMFDGHPYLCIPLK